MVRPLVASLLLVCLVLALGPAHSFAQDPIATEAELIALEYFGELRADPVDVAEIDGHLALIRAYMPSMAAISARPTWAVGQVIVKLTDPAFAKWLAGDPTDFGALSDQLGAVDLDQLGSIPWILVTFGEVLHPERLSELYLELDEVVYAEPNYIVGDGDDVTRESPTRYVFRHGEGDCLAGCINVWLYTFEIEGPSARLISATGSPPSVMALRMYPARPNPFNPSTTVQFELGIGGHARVDVFDLAGRRVATLLDQFMPAGPGEVRWTGRDDAGRLVASNVYVVRVRVGENVASQRVTLIE